MAMLLHDVYASLLFLMFLYTHLSHDTSHLVQLYSPRSQDSPELQSDTRTDSVIIMCQLQMTSYGCGHQRKTLFEPCALTQMLNPSSCKHTPSWCPNGLTTTRSNAVSIPCGRSHVSDSPYSCAELVLLQPFFLHEASIHAEFGDYNDRISHIADCMSLVSDHGRPELDYSLIPAADMQAMLDFQDEHYNAALPMYLHMARKTLDATSAQLAAAHTHTIDIMLGCTPSEYPPGLDMPIDIDALDPNNIGLSFYTQIYSRVRDTVRSAVDTLECTAILACLDGVGWTMPDDDAQALRDGLASLVRDRRVNPTQGGIRVSDYAEYLVEENKAVRAREWCDPLDIAEMEGEGEGDAWFVG